MHFLQTFPSVLVFDIVQSPVDLKTFFRLNIADVILKNNIELKAIIGDENKLEYIVRNINNPSKDNSLIENRLLNIFQQYQGHSIQFCASKAFLETKNWKSEMNDIRRKYLKNQQWWNLYEKFTKEELNASRSQILSEFESYRLHL